MPRSFLRFLPLLLFAPLGATAAAQTAEGSASSSLTRRIDYDVEYVTTGTGRAMTYSRVFILLTRGQPDSLQPVVPEAVTLGEQKAVSAASRASRRNTMSIPFGGHWYLAEYTADSLFVLGHAYRMAAPGSVLVVMVDRADHVGGLPEVAGTASIPGPIPAAFWTSATEPDKAAGLLIGWLRGSAVAAQFIK
jgi:hypothetical protein